MRSPQPVAAAATSSPPIGPPPGPPPVPAPERFADASWEALGTRVVLRLTDPRALSPARAAVEHELDAIDRACSRFRADSDIARVNASAGRAVHVSPLLADALALALRAAALTDGDVDPTVGSALVLAGYDRDWSLLEHSRPEDSSLREPAPLPRPPHRSSPRVPSAAGATSCSTTPRSRSACPRASRSTSARPPKPGRPTAPHTQPRWPATAVHSVGVGGDIAVRGPAPTRGWAVHVTDDHRSAPTAPGQTVTIRSGGLATSSIAVRRWSHEGRAMHHIIDPTTGAPVRGTWRTVSVAAASCADANIATTSALVRAGAASAWLAGLGVPARLVSQAGRVYTIGDWPAVAAEVPRR